MWARIKAACLNSLTMGWSYLLAFVGIVMQGIDALADALGDSNLHDQIGAAVGDAKTAGRILLGISVVTMIARLRSLRKAS